MEAPERSTPASKDTSRPLARGAETGTADGRRNIDRATNAMQPAVDRMASGAHETIDKVAGVANQAVQAVGARGAQLRGAQTRALDATRGYIRANPLAALGIAAGVGYLLSWLLQSR